MIIEKSKSIEEFQSAREISQISLKEWKKLEKENLELYFKLKSILYEYRLNRNASNIIDKNFRRKVGIKEELENQEEIFENDSDKKKNIRCGYHEKYYSRRFFEKDEDMTKRYAEELSDKEWSLD